MNYRHDLDEVLTVLHQGEIDVSGQFLWGSNYTFLAQVTLDQITLQAVYKPVRGERPLWDFPSGTLAAREVAAFLASSSLGWSFVPATVLRQDAAVGAGSLQLFVDADPERHYFTFSEDEKRRLRPVALFDVLINNADRKAGHVFMDQEDNIWLIDHGVCFHTDFKLRTVVWDFAGEAIPQNLLQDLAAWRERLDSDSQLRGEFTKLLSPAEVEALAHRADLLLVNPHFPLPAGHRPYPWPLV